jgi:hypothetical protein
MSDLTNLITDTTAAITEAESHLTSVVREPHVFRKYQRIVGSLRSALHSLEVAAEAEAELPHPLADLTDDYMPKDS